MLKSLRIRDLVLVEALEIEFGAGLNLLTGETGAGKSILLDALGLLVGARGDREKVRDGKTRAIVEATIELEPSAVEEGWADAHGVDDAEDGVWILRREMGADGRSRAFVNGSPTPVKTLAEFGDRWLELHGQHDARRLLQPDDHLALLDAFGRHDLERERVALRHAAMRAADDELRRRREAVADRERRLAAVEATIDEIEAVMPETGELDALDAQRNRLRHGAALREGLDRIAERLREGDDAAIDGLARARREADALAALDPGLAGAAERLDAAIVELEDLAEVFEDARRELDGSSESLEEVESRRAAIERLCLRHGEDEAAVLAVLTAARGERDALRDPDGGVAAAEGAWREAAEAYREAARALTAARRKAAKALAPAWRRQLRPLAMKDATLEVEVLPARGESALGVDRVELRLAANPGLPPRPLHRIASGGELSRVMLALAVVGGAGRASTQVFDEVDQGVGGAAADAVGSRLATLARSRQLICVTHLPQVAAYADRHLEVRKRVRDGTTATTVRPLEGERRVDELARMLSGERATDVSRSHARELIGEAGRRAGSVP